MQGGVCPAHSASDRLAAAVQQSERGLAQEPDWAPDAESGNFIGMNDEMTLRSEEAVLDEPSSEASMRFQPCTDDPEQDCASGRGGGATAIASCH